MAFATTKGGKLFNVITHNVIKANMKTESFVYCWLHTHALFEITGFHIFVRTPDVISNVQSTR